MPNVGLEPLLVDYCTLIIGFPYSQQTTAHPGGAIAFPHVFVGEPFPAWVMSFRAPFDAKDPSRCFDQYGLLTGLMVLEPLPGLYLSNEQEPGGHRGWQLSGEGGGEAPAMPDVLSWNCTNALECPHKGPKAKIPSRTLHLPWQAASR